MDEMDVIEPNFPPLEQNQLFGHVRKRIGISKYIDLVRTIKLFLEEEKQQRKEGKKVNAKAKYDRYVKLGVGRCYSAEELALKNNGKNIVDALKTTDLHSGYVQNQIEQCLEDAHVQGSYFDPTNLQGDFMPPEFEGMSSADGEVLNHTYISTTTLMPGSNGGRLSKEEIANLTNDRDIQEAEDAMHDAEMQIKRNEKLQSKLQLIIDQQFERTQLKKNVSREVNVPLILKSSPNSQIVPKPSEECVFYNELNQAMLNKTGELMNPENKASMEFSDVELAALADLYGSRKKGSQRKAIINEERKKLVIRVRESLKTHPEKTAMHLLSLMKARHCTLHKMKQKVFGESAKTLGTRYLDSIRRNSDAIKQNEYPCLSQENLLKEFAYLAHGMDAPKSSFMEKGDDVCTQLKYYDCGELVMQVEAVRWHKDAFELLQIGISPAQGEKIRSFVYTMKILFDVKIEHNTCTRIHKGDFEGLELYGNERMYLAIRLYHVLLVRLQTAFLQAEVDVAEYEFRKHCNEVGKARLLEKNPDAFLTKGAKMAMGLQSVKLPPTEGTAEEKMSRFLEAVKKRETIRGRGSPYSVHDFESDVMWAIGVEGNKLFTLPRILARLRETVSQISDADLDSYEKYYQQERSGIPDTVAKYKDEVFYASTEWLFAFKCRYSDVYVDDEWGTGEYGDVCRIAAKIVKSPVPDKDGRNDDWLKIGKRPNPSPNRGRPAKKKRRRSSKLDWSKR